MSYYLMNEVPWKWSGRSKLVLLGTAQSKLMFDLDFSVKQN